MKKFFEYFGRVFVSLALMVLIAGCGTYRGADNHHYAVGGAWVGGWPSPNVTYTIVNDVPGSVMDTRVDGELRSVGVTQGDCFNVYIGDMYQHSAVVTIRDGAGDIVGTRSLWMNGSSQPRAESVIINSGSLQISRALDGMKPLRDEQIERQKSQPRPLLIIPRGAQVVDPYSPAPPVPMR